MSVTILLNLTLVDQKLEMFLFLFPALSLQPSSIQSLSPPFSSRRSLSQQQNISDNVLQINPKERLVSLCSQLSLEHRVLKPSYSQFWYLFTTSFTHSPLCYNAFGKANMLTSDRILLKFIVLFFFMENLSFRFN